MKKNTALKLSLVLALSFALASSLFLLGCSSSAGTGTTDSGTASGDAAAATIAQDWQGSWYSKSEIVPPEQETDQYSIKIEADGSFMLKDGDAELYSGVIEVTDDPEQGYGDTTVDGADVKVQLVQAQGIYKFIFNAGDDWNQDLKKIIFQR